MFLPVSASPNQTNAAFRFLPCLLCLFLPCLPSDLYGKENPLQPNEKPAWLEGSGENLRIKITGEVTDEKGTPIDNPQLSISGGNRTGEKDRPVTVDKNQFYFWINAGPEYFIKVKATSRDGQKGVLKTIYAYEFRQLAIEGLKLKLLPFDHTAEITVVENGKPVEGAFVSADSNGFTLETRTDKAGIVRYSLFKDSTLTRLISWTDDHKLGIIENREEKNAKSNYKIELAPCRTQVIRVLDKASKAPVKNLPFLMSFWSGPPRNLSLSYIPLCNLKTNEQGEALFEWMPHWENPGTQFRSLDPNWFYNQEKQTENGVLYFHIQKSKQDQRKRVDGKITSSHLNKAGFLVQLESFEGEPEYARDIIYAFTDQEGRFSADCLPGATYCMYVNDARYVSNQMDLIPIAKEKVLQPELHLIPGQKIEVTYTAGPSKKPVANQMIHLTTPHPYHWLSKTGTISGDGGRGWWVRTDKNGQVQTYALEGARLEGSLYGQGWNSKQTLKVTSSGPNKLVFHQAFPEPRKITGRLRLDSGMQADLNEAILEIGSIDGEIKERMTVKTNHLGEFEFHSKSRLLGIFARTKDGKAAIASNFDQSSPRMELRLAPTAECRGRILGKEDIPLEGMPVSLHVQIKERLDIDWNPGTSFIGSTFEAKTDSEGFYTFTGIPTNAQITLSMGAHGNYPSRLLENFCIEPNETLPMVITQVETPTLKRTFAERYATTLRDCALSNFHTMVILFQPSSQNADFVRVNLVNYGINIANASFMQLLGEVGKETKHQEVMELARSKKWPTPENGKIIALALDAQGKELGRLEIDPTDTASPKLAAEFVQKHAPKQVDAKKKWEEAFAEAKASGRKVWVRISQRYCGPCFLLNRWLDDQKETLSKDYIFLKIDDFRDLHGKDMCKRLPESDEMGIPFHAIFDADGKLIINSKGPLGNIGFPSGIEGKKHLRKMLSQSRKNLTEKQIDDLIATLKD